MFFRQRRYVRSPFIGGRKGHAAADILALLEQAAALRFPWEPSGPAVQRFNDERHDRLSLRAMAEKRDDRRSVTARHGLPVTQLDEHDDLERKAPRTNNR